MQVVGKYDDKANVELAAKITSDVLAAHPDLTGICGFDSNSGPGIALAVKEAGKVGKVKITTLDWESEHLQLVKNGVIQMLAGQKHELFTWYGAQLLFDMVHRLSSNDAASGITNVPTTNDTGLLRITKENFARQISIYHLSDFTPFKFTKSFFFKTNYFKNLLISCCLKLN